MQQHYNSVKGEMPTVDDLERWLRKGPEINDGDDEDDNVTNTGLTFVRVDALEALKTMDGELSLQLLQQGQNANK